MKYDLDPADPTDMDVNDLSVQKELDLKNDTSRVSDPSEV